MNHHDRPVEASDEDLFRPEAIVVRLLLSLPGISQDHLAQTSEISQSLISAYQRGKLIPSPETLEQLAQAAGWPLPFVEQMAAAAIRVREIPRATIGSFPIESPALEVARKVAVRVEAALVEIGYLLSSEAEDTERSLYDAHPSAYDAIAEDLWSRMADLDARQRRVLVDFSSAFHRPSLALRLAEEGKRLEAERPDEAAELARLAQHVASLCGARVPS
ncbi:MAG TPA: helix-turn-helix transcriptional regulator [Thermoanaerobaculia bacterium]|nr:helix-turn-helix transcriptional regulator [Thermoanaerobaculia bacterium]